MIRSLSRALEPFDVERVAQFDDQSSSRLISALDTARRQCPAHYLRTDHAGNRKVSRFAFEQLEEALSKALPEPGEVETVVQDVVRRNRANLAAWQTTPHATVFDYQPFGSLSVGRQRAAFDDPDQVF